MTNAPNTKTTLPERQRSPPETIIDPDGDLWLVVGTSSPQKFLVSSKVLELVSTVLRIKLKERESKALLTPSTSDFEGLSSAPEFHLSDNEPEAMKIILLVVHHRTVRMTDGGWDSICADTLHEIAFLCHKYDIIGPMRNWFDRCIGTWGDKYEGDSKDEGKRLYIVWVFGKRELFDDLINAVVRYCTERAPGEKGWWTHYEKSWIETYYMAQLQKDLPLQIVKHIRSARLGAIGEILRELNEFYKELLGQKGSEAMAVLGALVQTMHSTEITPLLTKAEHFTCSIDELRGKLKNSNRFHVFKPDGKRFFTNGKPKRCLKPSWEWFQELKGGNWEPTVPDIPGHIVLQLEQQAAK